MGRTDLVIFLAVCAADVAVLILLRRRHRRRKERERFERALRAVSAGHGIVA